MKTLIALTFLITSNLLACECIPEVESATVDSTGTTLTVVFNKSMSLIGKGDGWLDRFSAVYAIQYQSGDGENIWTFSITGPVLSTDVMLLELNQAPKDELGYDLLNDTIPVENNSVQ